MIEKRNGNTIANTGKKYLHILLVFWPIYRVASTGTYPDMHRQMCLVDESKSVAILCNYFLPRCLEEETNKGLVGTRKEDKK
jgi:hypothetical protein